MLEVVLRRLGSLVPVVLGVTIAVFLMVHLLPGDPVDVLQFGSTASPEQLAQLRHELGLDQALPIQYVHFLGQVLHGDLGTSVRTGEPTMHLIRVNLPSTLQLTVAGMLLGIVLGFSFGIVAALRANSVLDSTVIAFSTLGFALPAFWLASLLIFLFAVRLGWFPATSRGWGKDLVLPTVALGLGVGSVIARIVRASLVEVLQEEYVLVAKAKGLPGRIILFRHALKNALIPVVTILGLQFGSLLAGAVVVEVTFARPGIGNLIVRAIDNRDYPVIQGGVLVAALIYVCVNLAVDVLYVFIDPRVRSA